MKFCAEGAKFNEHIAFSIAVLHAVLDAVLEDKPAQPLPCGSYLVEAQCCASVVMCTFVGSKLVITDWVLPLV